MLDATKVSNIIAYCKAHGEVESGGYISAAGEFVPMINNGIHPTEYFNFISVPDDAQMIIHSHPGGPFCPSEFDQRQQIASDIPWGIVAYDDTKTEFFVFGDSAPIPPLIGRGFRHYVTDCYAAVRDLYRLHCGVTLPHMPREWQWWKHGERLLDGGYIDAGFRVIPFSDIQPGDALIMTVRSNTPNHSAVWLGESLIYHHNSGTRESDPGRPAIVEPVGDWTPHITAALRHENGSIARAAWPSIRKILSV